MKRRTMTMCDLWLHVEIDETPRPGFRMTAQIYDDKNYRWRVLENFAHSWKLCQTPFEALQDLSVELFDTNLFAEDMATALAVPRAYFGEELRKEMN